MSKTYPDLYRTSYPDSFDQFTKYLNVLSTDGPLIRQYQQAIENGDNEKANEALEKIPAYKQKLLTAQDLNKFLDAITAIERFYKTDIEPYAEEKHQEWKDIVGEFVYVGEYDPNIRYYKNNYVHYAVGDNNFLYIALQEVPENVSPSDDGVYWAQLTLPGKSGQPSLGLAFTGPWDASNTYKINECVEYDKALWICVQGNTATPPMQDSEYWNFVALIGTYTYPLSEAQPVSPEDEELWFKIVK